MTNKENYMKFVNITCEILGLNKPVEVLKLCQTASEFIRPYEKRIAELESIINNNEFYQYGYRQAQLEDKSKVENNEKGLEEEIEGLEEEIEQIKESINDTFEECH